MSCVSAYYRRFLEESLYLIQRNIVDRRIREALYGELRVSGFGDLVDRIRRLCVEGDIEVLIDDIYNATRKVLNMFGVYVDGQLQELMDFESSGDSIIMFIDDHYPSRLLDSRFYPPPILYAKGFGVDIYTALKASPIVAVVGTRRPSDDGCRMAEKIGRMLASDGFSIVTGLAQGIDECVSKGFVEAVHEKEYRGSILIGIRPYLEPLPNSLPKQTRFVYGQKGVMLISENLSTYSNSSNWIKSQLYLRNRIIASLADAIVVIEARAKSASDIDRGGSMSMIKFGIDKGKPVFIWNTTSKDPEITTAMNIYREKGAIPFNDESFIRKDLSTKIANKIEVDNDKIYVLFYFLPLALMYKYGYRVFTDIGYGIGSSSCINLGTSGIRRLVTREYLQGELKKINARQDRFLHHRYLDNIFAVGVYYSLKGEMWRGSESSPDDITSMVSDVKSADRECIEVASLLISKLFDIYEELKNVEALSYVPCHEQNLRIDPKTNEYICIAEELAKRVGKYVNKPVVKLVEKVKHVDLKNMSVEKRWLTVSELYKPLGRDISMDIESIAIIDDVITSGATLSYIAKLLKEYFNVKKVYGVAIAVTK